MFKNINKIPVATWIQYSMIYFMLMLNESLLLAKHRETYYIIFFGVAILVALSLNIKILNNPLIIWCTIGFIVSLILNRLLNGGGVGIGYFFRFASKALVVYVAYAIDRKNMVNRYVRMVVLFAGISLVCYLASLIMPGVMKAILRPSFVATYTSSFHGWKVTWSDYYYGRFLYAYKVGGRNSGIYTEPGLYQMTLVTAIYCLVFMQERLIMEKKKQIISLIILSATMLSTMSTTAFICLAVVFLGALFQQRSKKNNLLKNTIIYGFIIVLFFIIIDYFFRGNESIAYRYIFYKLAAMSSAGEKLTNSSGDARIAVIRTLLVSIRRYPFGSGVYNFYQIATELGYRDIIAGSGLWYYLAVLGILGWLSVMIYILAQAYMNAKDMLNFIVFTMLYVISTSTQQYILVPGFLLIACVRMRKKGSSIIRKRRSS